jgi:hypothetical protein
MYLVEQQCHHHENSKKTSIKEKVVFFYVSVDLDFEKWKNASEMKNYLKNENNLLALNN